MTHRFLAWNNASRARSAFGVLGTSESEEIAALGQKAAQDLSEINRNDLRYHNERTMRTDYPTRRGF